jgi:hypothetical protein
MLPPSYVSETLPSIKGGDKGEPRFPLHKLITKEDSTHVHKFLGLFSLLHYAHRYYLLCVYGSMFLQTRFDLAMIALHGCLSLSSLIFHIPKKRHTKLPMIYPEFRLHSIAFGLRSVVCCFVDFYGGTYRLYYKMGVCFGTMIIADVVTKLYAEPGDTTLRAMPYAEDTSKEDRMKITKFHSNQQVSATVLMLCNIDSAFSPLFAIQFAAFLMTLVRKGIIRPNTWHLLYVLALMINIFVFYTITLSQLVNIFVSIKLFRLLRMRFRMNKYLGWMITFGVYSMLDVRFIDTYDYAQTIVNCIIAIYIMKNVYTTRSLGGTKSGNLR